MTAECHGRKLHSPAHIYSIAQQAAQLPHLHPPRLSGLIHLSRWLQVQMHPFGLACIDREAEVGEDVDDDIKHFLEPLLGCAVPITIVRILQVSSHSIASSTGRAGSRSRTFLKQVSR